MLLILDEAQTGLCRTGSGTRSNGTGWSRTSDPVQNAGRGTAAGRDHHLGEIEEQAHERGYLFYTTMSHDPLVAAVGLTVLDVLQRDQLAERAGALGGQLRDGLWPSRTGTRWSVTSAAVACYKVLSSCSIGRPSRAPIGSAPGHPALPGARPAHDKSSSCPGSAEPSASHPR